MLKKFYCALLLGALLFVQSAYAEGDNSIYPKRTIYLNGEQVAIQRTTTDYLQYTTIAELAGFSTTYDHAARTVVSTCGADSITFPLPEYEFQSVTATILKDNVQQTISVDPTLWEGVTYFSVWDIELLFGYESTTKRYYNYEDYANYDYFFGLPYDIDIYLYDLNTYKENILASIPNLTKFLQSFQLETGTALSGNISIAETIASDAFGLNITGSSDIGLTALFSSMGIGLDASIKNSGLHQIAALNHIDDNVAVDFDKPIEIQLLTDGTALYVKSEELHEQLIENELHYYNTEAFKEQTLTDASGKWLQYEELPALASSLSLEEFIVKAIWDIAAADYEVYLPETIQKRLTLITSLFADKYFTFETDSDGNEQFCYSIPGEATNNILRQLAETVDEIPHNNPVTAFFKENSACTITLSNTISPDGAKFITTDTAINIQYQPENWNRGLLDIQFIINAQLETTTSTATVSIPTPGEYVSISAIQEQARLPENQR